MYISILVLYDAKYAWDSSTNLKKMSLPVYDFSIDVWNRQPEGGGLRCSGWGKVAQSWQIEEEQRYLIGWSHVLFYFYIILMSWWSLSPINININREREGRSVIYFYWLSELQHYWELISFSPMNKPTNQWVERFKEGGWKMRKEIMMHLMWDDKVRKMLSYVRCIEAFCRRCMNGMLTSKTS